MLIPIEEEKDFIYSLIFDDSEKFEETISNNRINFERIASIVSSNRIEHFVLNKLKPFSRFSKLPKFFFEQLEKNYFKKAIPTLKIIEKVFLLSNKLQEINLEHVFLKGIALHDQNKTYIRPMRDIDVLVNPEDLTQIVKLAESLGFKFKNKSNESIENFIDNSSFYDLPLMTDENGVFLEIHFRITTDKDNCLLKESLFESKRLIKIHENDVYVPCSNNLFTHLVFHASKKGNFDVGLISLVDLIQIIDEIDKNKVLKVSESIDLKQITELFIELIECSGNKTTPLSKKVEKLKEVLIFPSINSKITEIFMQESFVKMLLKLKNTLFVSKHQLQREFGKKGTSHIFFYLIKRWKRQIKKFSYSILFVVKNLVSVNKRAKMIEDLFKN